MGNLDPVVFRDPVGLPWAAASVFGSILYFAAKNARFSDEAAAEAWAQLLRRDAHHRYDLSKMG